MLKKSKYDVMVKQLKGANKLILSYLSKMISLNKKIKKGIISETEIEIETFKLLNELLPSIKAAYHVGYENAKDMLNIDKDALFNYLESKGIDKATFAYNYAQKQKDVIKLLAVLAIIEKENLQLFDLEDPAVAIQLLNGEDFMDVLYDRWNDMSDESSELLEEIFDDDFNIKEMSDELKELVETYHRNYMQKEVYPYVTKEITPEKQVIKMAKGLGKSKKVNVEIKR